MVYTPDDVVWTFNVKQQKEIVKGHQTSHRLNAEGLSLLKKKTPKVSGAGSIHVVYT